MSFPRTALVQVIPEGAGPVKGSGVPVFLPVPAWAQGAPEGGQGQGGAPGWTNDLEAGPLPADAGEGRELGIGVVCSAPVQPLIWQAPGCGHPFGLPAVAGRGGMGRVRVRAAGSIR